jgi:hypothetical protein
MDKVSKYQLFKTTMEGKLCCNVNGKVKDKSSSMWNLSKQNVLKCKKSKQENS